MSDGSVLDDSPTELLHEVVENKGDCGAQSVVPLEDGTYLVACACEEFEVVAPDRWKGLNLAREHTGSSSVDGIPEGVG